MVFTVIAALVTIAFKADVDAQAGAYATGVLALMTSAAVAVTLTEWRRGHRKAAAFFGIVAAVFAYTISVTILDRPEGLVIAVLFIAMILILSVVSRIARSTELRVQRVTLDAAAETAVFLEVVVSDASEFSSQVEVTGARIGAHRVLRATGPSVPNVRAAVLLAVSDIDDMPSHIYFEWSERAPGQNALRFLFAGEGDVPPLTHEILRRAEPDPEKRPMVHVGG